MNKLMIAIAVAGLALAGCHREPTPEEKARLEAKVQEAHEKAEEAHRRIQEETAEVQRRVEQAQARMEGEGDRIQQRVDEQTKRAQEHTEHAERTAERAIGRGERAFDKAHDKERRAHSRWADTHVDLNTATPGALEELGLTAEEAKRVIAGRPYKSKTDLLSREILSAERYGKVQSKIVAE